MSNEDQCIAILDVLDDWLQLDSDDLEVLEQAVARMDLHDDAQRDLMRSIMLGDHETIDKLLSKMDIKPTECPEKILSFYIYNHLRNRDLYDNHIEEVSRIIDRMARWGHGGRGENVIEQAFRYAMPPQMVASFLKHGFRPRTSLMQTALFKSPEKMVFNFSRFPDQFEVLEMLLPYVPYNELILIDHILDDWPLGNYPVFKRTIDKIKEVVNKERARRSEKSWSSSLWSFRKVSKARTARKVSKARTSRKVSKDRSARKVSKARSARKVSKARTARKVSRKVSKASTARKVSRKVSKARTARKNKKSPR